MRCVPMSGSLLQWWGYCQFLVRPLAYSEDLHLYWFYSETSKTSLKIESWPGYPRSPLARWCHAIPRFPRTFCGLYGYCLQFRCKFHTSDIIASVTDRLNIRTNRYLTGTAVGLSKDLDMSPLINMTLAMLVTILVVFALMKLARLRRAFSALRLALYFVFHGHISLTGTH